MEREHREADSRRVPAIRGVRGLEGYASAAVLAASQPDFRRTAGAGGRSVCGGRAIRPDAAAVCAESFFRERTNPCTRRFHYDSRTTPASVPAIHQAGTCRPKPRPPHGLTLSGHLTPE